MEKHAKNLPFDLCELLHFKVMSMETSGFLSSGNNESCLSKDVCLLVGFFLWSNTWILTEALPRAERCHNALSDAHPPVSKKLEHTLQLFFYLAEVL